MLFVGFQPEGTRGRRILEGATTSRIFGIDVPVECHTSVLNGLSAHADKGELLRWLKNFQQSPKMTFIVHGEGKAALSLQLQGSIIGDLGWKNTFIPQYLESFELFNSI